MLLEIFGGGATAYSAHGGYEAGVDPKLRACPFCGGEEIDVINTHTPYYAAECQSCGATGPRGSAAGYTGTRIRSRAKAEALHREAFRAAITAWNGRPVIGGRRERYTSNGLSLKLPAKPENETTCCNRTWPLFSVRLAHASVGVQSQDLSAEELAREILARLEGLSGCQFGVSVEYVNHNVMRPEDEAERNALQNEAVRRTDEGR